MKAICLLLVGLCCMSAAFAQPVAPSRIEFHDATDRLRAGNVVNVVTYSAPREIALKELGLDVLAAAPGIMIADEIRIFNSRTEMDRSPAVRIWRNSREGGRWWFQTGGTGSADEFVIRPGQVVLVMLRATTNDVAWVNPLRRPSSAAP